MAAGSSPSRPPRRSSRMWPSSIGTPNGPMPCGRRAIRRAAGRPPCSTARCRSTPAPRQPSSSCACCAGRSTSPRSQSHSTTKTSGWARGMPSGWLRPIRTALHGNAKTQRTAPIAVSARKSRSAAPRPPACWLGPKRRKRHERCWARRPGHGTRIPRPNGSGGLLACNPRPGRCKPWDASPAAWRWEAAKMRPSSFCGLMLVVGGIMLGGTKPALAGGSDELRVTHVTRLTHPAYRAGNLYYAVRDWAAWNRDHTRMMLGEEAQTFTTEYGTKTGRRLVWGFIDERPGSLRHWTTLEEYEAAARPVPGAAQMTNWKAAYWSPFPGEEAVIYAPFRDGADAVLQRIDTDSGQIAEIIPLECNGVDCRNMLCYNWTRDQRLLCSYGYEDFSRGGWEIDVRAPSKQFVTQTPSAWCTDERKRWPDMTHGHGST